MKKGRTNDQNTTRVDSDTMRIPPKTKYDRRKLEDKKLRVAAYCRVSTDSDEQYTSFEAQRQHYLDSVSKHENWTLIEIYADEGISGTSTKKRVAFNRMIEDAKEGKFDLIITKTVSRFTRNVVDGLVAARELLKQDPPVGIFFEEDKFNTLMPNCEFILTIMLSLAQGESTKKSETMQTSYEWRYQRNDYFCPTNYLLGYETNEDGDIVVEPEGAKTVRAIFTMYLAGTSASAIARTLTELTRPTAKNNLIWSGGSVMNIIRNEKYCGDIIGQKTYTVDCLEHRKAKNRGQKWLHYMANHHEAIISREEYIRALLMSGGNRSSRYFNPSYEIRIISEGLLRGFIPINCAFGGYDAGHYMGACDTIEPFLKHRKVEVLHIEGCEVARAQEFGEFGTALVTISSKSFSFNRECVSLLPKTEYAELLIHPNERLLAVRKTTADNQNAIPWCAGPVSSAVFMPILYSICGWNPNWKYKTEAVCLVKKSERVLILDLNEVETIIYNPKSDDGPHVKRTSKAYKPVSWRDSFGDTMPDSLLSCRRLHATTLSRWQIDAKAMPVSGFENFAPVPTEDSIKAVLAAIGGEVYE